MLTALEWSSVFRANAIAVRPLLIMVGLIGAAGAEGAWNDASAQNDGDCLLCSDCGSEDQEGNLAWNLGHPLAMNSAGDGPHGGACYLTGYCEDEHARPCRGPHQDGEDLEAVIQELEVAVRMGDLVGAQTIVAEQYADGALYLAAERSAIQVLGCNGTVIYHLPLQAFRVMADNSERRSRSRAIVTDVGGHRPEAHAN